MPLCTEQTPQHHRQNALSGALSTLAERRERSLGHRRQGRSSVAALRPLDGVLWNNECSSGGRQHHLLRILQHARPGIFGISTDPDIH